MPAYEKRAQRAAVTVSVPQGVTTDGVGTHPRTRKGLAARHASRSRSISRNQWRSLARVADIADWEDEL